MNSKAFVRMGTSGCPGGLEITADEHGGSVFRHVALLFVRVVERGGARRRFYKRSSISASALNDDFHGEQRTRESGPARAGIELYAQRTRTAEWIHLDDERDARPSGTLERSQ